MNKYYNRAIIILFILLMISFGFNVYYNATDKNIEKIITKTDTITNTITIHDTLPKLVYEKQIIAKTDTFTVEKIIKDTASNQQQAIVNVPITQKQYSDDSTYTAWVSGYKQQLDSIQIQQREKIITNEITIIKKDNKKFSIGPSIHAGYNPHTKQLEYGIGVSLTFGLIKW